MFGFTLLHHACSETALQIILIFPLLFSWSLVTCVDLSVVELEDSVRVHLVRETSDTQHTNTMLARIRYRCSTLQYSAVQHNTVQYSSVQHTNTMLLARIRYRCSTVQ